MARTRASVGAKITNRPSSVKWSLQPMGIHLTSYVDALLQRTKTVASLSSSPVSAGKSNKARCSAAPPPSNPSTSGTSDKGSRSQSGGNPVCPRETPKWQKPITNFFVCTPSNGADTTVNDDNEDVAAGSSKPKKKRNVIQSDDEHEELDVEDPPKNQALDESIILEPLNGESSHKIDEYYVNKDKGQEQSNKENIDVNGGTEKQSAKRDREETDDEHASKRAKIS